jgi:hypothetical protein
MKFLFKTFLNFVHIFNKTQNKEKCTAVTYRFKILLKLFT